MPLGDRLVLVQADITTLAVDAIVNAANEALLPGAGVCGAIHRAAGRRLADACRAVAPCPTGEVRLTPGFDLKARHVIHAVGPVWHGGSRGEDALLGSCYRAALALADERGFETIAFPAISTGVYGFPIERATLIAMYAIAAAFERPTRVRQVTCACFGAEALGIYGDTADYLGF